MNPSNRPEPIDSLSNATRSGAVGRWLGRFPWIGIGLAVSGIVVTHLLSSRNDFAAANIVTFLLGILIWMMLILGFKNSALPRVLWRSLLLLPIVSLAAFLSAFTLERLDGELLPRFRYRWATKPPLPVAEAETDTVTTALIEPKPTDYAQFLGLNRDGVTANVEINSNWDASSPTIVWKKPVGSGWSSFAIQGDLAVTMEQRDEQEWVTAYDIRDGAMLWHYSMDSKHTNLMGGIGPRSTPLIAENKVYACSAVSRIVCLNIENGDEIWAQELLELSNTTQMEFETAVTWGRSASPLLWKSQIIIPLGGKAPTKTLIALDRETGQELWTAGNQQISYSSPTRMTLGGKEQIVLVAESSVHAFDPATQDELWSVAWPGSSSSSANVSQPIQVDDSHVFLSKGYGTGCQLMHVQLKDEAWTTDIVWRNELALRTKFTSAVIHNGYVYGLSDGILECVNLANGEQQWKRGRYRQGQLLLVGSNLLITSEKGQIVLVAADPTAFRELASMPVIGDVTWNTPAISGNRLLIRNSDEAACVLLPLLNSPATTSPTTSQTTPPASTSPIDEEVKIVE